MRKKLVLCLTFLSIISIASIGLSGEIEYSFREKLHLMPDDSYTRALIFMEEQADLQALEMELMHPGQASRQVRHEKVVRTCMKVARETQGPVLRYLACEKRDSNVKMFKSLWICNVIGVEATPQVIFEAARLPGVDTVFEDGPIFLVEPVEENTGEPHVTGVEGGIRDIKADSLWYQGITGEGRLASHLDTGVQGSHEALTDRWRGNRPEVPWYHAWYDPVTFTEYPFDAGSHGTHTMGTICGRAGADTIGVAFGAEWISAGVIDRVSLERTKLDALAAFNWTADPDSNPSTVDDVPDVSSNSWGFSPLYHGVPKCWDFFWQALDACEAAGVAVVFAAGNEGSGSETLRCPADRITTDVNAYSVGALNAGSQSIASFSSRGPSGCDHETIKPEVCARGVDVRSSIPGGYGSMSGTSMACPHVAGAVLLLRQINPDLTSSQVKQILMDTATDLGAAGEENTYGWGLINLAAAGRLAQQGYGTVKGTVTNAETGDPLAAAIEVLGGDWHTTADDFGLYTLPLPGDTTYTLEASYFGFIPEQVELFVAAEDTIIQDFSLQPAASGELEGYVTDILQKPLAGATVSILDTPIEPTVTNGLGYYHIPVIPGENTYTVEVRECRVMTQEQNVYIVSGEMNELDFTMDVWAPDDMESGENGWDHYIVTPSYNDEWHLETYRNHTPGGQTSWKCGGGGSGNYSDYDDSGLVSHCLVLLPNSTMTFWHWMDAEIYDQNEAWDGGIVEISTDDGSTWVQITPEGGYPYIIHDNPASPFPAGTPCFSGYHNWQQEEFDLTGYEGEAYIRFRFGTDGYETEEGWYIDDVVVSSPIDLTITASNTPDEVVPGGTAEWRLDLVNNSGTPVEVDVWLSIDSEVLPPPYSPTRVLLLSNFTVPGYFSGGRTVYLNVHPKAPAGTYTVENIVGEYYGTIYAEDIFTTEVTPAKTGRSTGSVSAKGYFRASVSDF